MMALKGIKVLELAGLAPAPFCGLVLSDFGARVIRVERPNTQTFCLDRLTRGKESIALDLTKAEGKDVFSRVLASSDVLIDPYRPNVMEKLRLGPENVFSMNPGIIYARISGFGQNGPLAKKAGHDINFLSISGVLSKLGAKNATPKPPLNVLGDFGGGLMCAFGIVSALLERSSSGKGQVLDANITDASAYLSTWLWRASDLPFWGSGRGDSWFDGGIPFYDTYECLDGKYIAVGCLEKPFFEQMLKGLGIPGKYDQSPANYAPLREELIRIFCTKTRDDWTHVFSKYDACVTPVLTLEEAPSHEHNKERRSFFWSKGHQHGAEFKRDGPEPLPSPRMSRLPFDPSHHSQEPLHPGQHTKKVLKEIGYSSEEISQLVEHGIVKVPPSSA